jgi:TRAP-type C4-dicarboxylate transport system substrate-binding protein
MRPFNALATTAVVTVLLGGMAAAQDRITLKVTQPWPANHPQWLHAGQVFVDHVTEATQGQVQFEVYHAAQLGDDSLSLLTSGLADLAIISTNYAPDRFPLSGVTELPGMFESACEANRKYRAIATPGGALYENEYGPLSLHPIYMAMSPPASLVMHSEEVDSLEDIRGLKIRAAGGAAAETVRALGGVPMQTVASELYDALSRGTIDGAMYYFVGMPSFSLEEVFHTGIDNLRFGAAPVMATMTESRWSELPANVQEAINDAAPLAEASLCAWFDENERGIRDELVAERGFTVTSLPDADLDVWEGLQQQIAADWAKLRDDNGRNGTAVLEGFRAAQ